MAKSPPLGDQELDVLRYVTEHAPISVRDTAESFGEERGLARTTIQTVMERLRKKGYLNRVQEAGVYQYSPKLQHGDLMTGLVADFVERSLGGALSPFVVYLADSGVLTPKQVKELRQLAETLKASEEGKS